MLLILAEALVLLFASLPHLVALAFAFAASDAADPAARTVLGSMAVIGSTGGPRLL
jgi:hypothetical protein